MKIGFRPALVRGDRKITLKDCDDDDDKEMHFSFLKKFANSMSNTDVVVQIYS